MPSRAGRSVQEDSRDKSVSHSFSRNRREHRRFAVSIETLEDRVVPTFYATTTLLAESLTSGGIGANQTLTATVSSTNGVPTGTVAFYDGATQLGSATLSSGSASFSTTSLALGAHHLYALYDGANTYYPSWSGGVLPGNTINPFAGNGTAGSSGNGGAATSAELSAPNGVAFDAAGDMFIADSANNEIREVNTNGVISIYAGTGTAGSTGDGGQATSAKLYTPMAIAFNAAGDLFIADYHNNKIREVNTSGVINTIAGTGTGGYTGDGGQATSAELHAPDGLAFDSAGNLYFADSANQVIRKITTAGVISTVAGTGTPGYSGDGGQATSATMNVPLDVAIDASGDLIIADSGNEVVRMVTPAGVISTIAGNHTLGYTGDGGQATSAELGLLQGVSVDSLGDIFISDTTNNVIREVFPNGVITTVVGTGTAGSTGNGGPASGARTARTGGSELRRQRKPVYRRHDQQRRPVRGHDGGAALHGNHQPDDHDPFGAISIGAPGFERDVHCDGVVAQRRSDGYGALRGWINGPGVRFPFRRHGNAFDEQFGSRPAFDTRGVLGTERSVLRECVVWRRGVGDRQHGRRRRRIRLDRQRRPGDRGAAPRARRCSV